MKKPIALLLALVMCLSLCACGGSSETPQASENISEEAITPEPEPKLALKDTASTDIAEFTLEDSQFTIYVSNVSTNYVEPTEEANEFFAASIGHCYVSTTFTIENKDRGGSISFEGGSAEWALQMKVTYKGEEYSVKGFDLNHKDGLNYLNLSYSAVVEKDSGKVIEKHGSYNYLLFAGESVTLRAFGIIPVEPAALTDGFDLTVSVPNSKGEYEEFTYEIPAC